MNEIPIGDPPTIVQKLQKKGRDNERRNQIALELLVALLPNPEVNEFDKAPELVGVAFELADEYLKRAGL